MSQGDEMDNDFEQVPSEELEDMQGLDTQEIVATIVELGNQILANMGYEEAIDDVSVFFTDTFYIKFFQSAFPDFDFSGLEISDDEEQMAANIQTLIDLLSSKILMYDLGHIQGEEIVNGNPEHCINLLQLVKEISGMMNTNSNVQASGQLYDDEEDAHNSGLLKDDEPSGRQFHPDDPDADLDQIEIEGDEDAEEMLQRQRRVQSDDDEDEEGVEMMDQELENFNHHQHPSGKQHGRSHLADLQDNEVSINMEDAIATAEELNQRGENQRRGLNDDDEENEEDVDVEDDDEIDDEMRQQIIDGLDDFEGEHQQLHHQHDAEEYEDEEDEDDEEQQQRQEMIDDDDDADEQMVHEIAGMVTDGAHERDHFEQIREQKQQQMRNQQISGEEVDDRRGLEDYDEEDEDAQYGDQEDENEDDVAALAKQFDPDLLAVAHDMGIEMNSEQIHEVQKFIQGWKDNKGGDIQQQDDEEMEDEDDQSPQAQSAHHSQSQPNKGTSMKKSNKKSYDEQELIAQQMQLAGQQYSNDEQAYAYLAQQEQMDQNEGENEEMDDDQELEDEDQEEGQDGDEDEQIEDQGEDFDQFHLDVIENLSPEEKDAIYRYLKDEYEKNPETFQLQKEKLQEQLQQFINNNQDGDNEDEEEQNCGEDEQEYQDDEEDEDDGQKQDGEGEEEEEEEQEELLQIEGGGQQIEEADDHTTHGQDGQYLEEQEFSEQEIAQQLTQEQIQQLLLAQQQLQQQYNGEDGGDDEQVEVHQMQQIYSHTKKTTTKKRKNLVPQVAQLPPNKAQKSKHISSTSKKLDNLTGNKQMVANLGRVLQNSENLDPNALQRLMQVPSSQSQSRPRPPHQASTSGNKRSSANRQNQRPQTAKTRQPAQSYRSYKQFIANQQQGHTQQSRIGGRPQTAQPAQHSSSTKNSHINVAPLQSQSQMRKHSSKRKVKRSQLNTIQHPAAQHKAGHIPISQPLIDDQQLLQQLQQQSEMPMFNEEFLNQLSPEQLAQVIQHQQALIQQHPQGGVAPQKKSHSAAHLPPRPATAKRSRSAKRNHQSGPNSLVAAQVQGLGQTEQSSRQQARTRALIYSQPFGPAVISSRRKTSKHSSRNRDQKVRSSQSGHKQSKHGSRRKKVQPGQGILLNNFFPALEGGGGPGSGEKLTHEQQEALYAASQGNEDPSQAQEQVIDEVPPEEEEGESQEVVNSRLQQEDYSGYQNQVDDEQIVAYQLLDAFEQADPQQKILLLQQMTDEQKLQLQQLQEERQRQLVEQEEGQTVDEEDDNDQDDIQLTDTQLIQLLQNSDKLTPEQQAQLQHILKTRYKNEIKSQKQQQYQNIYNILTENMAKAKVRLSKLAESSPTRATSKQEAEDKETLDRITRQKKEFETLLRSYAQDIKVRNKNKEAQQKRIERQIQKEIKQKEIREKKFEEDLINQQKSLMYKRNAQQVRLCQKVYKLASDLEKNKLLDEKRHYIETQQQKKSQKKIIVDSIEQFYKDKINMLRERIETEKFERKIAQAAQKDALIRMKRELDFSKKKEIERYLNLLKQEDQKYDFQSSNLKKIETEIIKLYKK